MTASTPTRPTLDDIYAARERLDGIAVRTPLVPFLGAGGGPDLLLKLELLQPIGSFKLRGVFNAVAALSEEEREGGISTNSSGNTAQALAWSGRHFGVEARSLMPEDAPQAKFDAIERWGGIPVTVTREHLFRYMSDRLWEDEPYAFIHPWINPNVMAGAGTIALEILEDAPDLQSVFVPVGGGGLSSGIGIAIKALRPDVRMYAVEPSGCCALHASLLAGKPSQVTCNTICDGVAVPLVVPEVYDVLKDVIDEVILVDDDAVLKTMREIVLRNKIVVEPSGALAATGALQVDPGVRGVSACIVTGGSVDPNLLARLLTSGES